MRKNIDTYVQAIAHDYSMIIVGNEYKSIANYIISEAEIVGWNEYFDDEELDETGEPSVAQIEELKGYLNENYDYLPE